jgi:hypothetical protein
MGNILLSAFIIICGTLWIFKMTMEDGKMTARDTTMTFTWQAFGVDDHNLQFLVNKRAGANPTIS